MRDRSSNRQMLPFGALVALLGAVPGAGCRQLAGIEDPHPPDLVTDSGDGGDGGSASCGVAFASPDCAKCMAGSCCAEEARCTHSASCAGLEGCVGACPSGDGTCASACRGRFPDGDGAESAALHTCEAVRCAAACHVTCGGYVYASPACGACSVMSCCDAVMACVGNAECSVLGACERACTTGDDACLLRCELDHPDGVAGERALGSCLSTKCASSCIAAEWACLQHPTPPPPTQRVVITYRLYDYVTLRPVAGLTVRACGKTDIVCAVPLVSTTTNALGTAVLPLTSSFFDGYAEISGGDYGPVLLWLPPLTKSFVTPILGIATNATFTPIRNQIAPVNPDLSTLLVRAHDCAGEPAAGVHFAIDGNGAPFYFENAGVSTTRTVTDGQGNSAGGYGGFVNVAPGLTINVVASVPQLGLTYPPRPITTRAGALGYTEVVLYASPP